MILVDGLPFCLATVAFLPCVPTSPGGILAAEQAQLLPDTGLSCLGRCVAADGDTIVAGAFHDSTLGQFAGAAYVFVHVGGAWTQQAKLLPNDGMAHDFFGCGVEIEGDLAFVGATDAGNGSVYVFSRVGGQWSQQQEIVPSATTPSAFGAAILSKNDALFVGAPLDDGGPVMRSDQGAVYIFTRGGTAWVQQQKLMASDAEAGDQFGGAMDVDGDMLVVAAQGEDDVASNAGAVYVFRRSGTDWIEEDKLGAVDGELEDRFGAAVGVQGDVAVVGTDLAQAIYVFRRSGTDWALESTLSYPSNGRFGRTLSWRGDVLLAGSMDDSTFMPQAGSAFVFRRAGTNWLPVSTLVPTDLAPGDAFGSSVALAGSRAVVGAFLDGTVGTAAGAAYVFSAGVPTSYCTAKTNSMGCVPFVATSGVPSVSATHSFEIRAESVLRDEPGIILYGFKKANFNFHGGKLCLKAPVFRLLPPKPAKATGQPPCTGVLRRNFQNHLQSGANPALSVGQTVRAQWLLRDPADPLGFGDGLTDAVQFTVGP